ncbi:MAG: hypothetical protein MPW14_05405 [Candidatus Manganitrophus sp.]|nr:MAG: hypothetical protein MPW14_05405 [Candidatus Manganitrophus sp.]
MIEADPFVTLDREGVGELVKIAAERGRRRRAPASSSGSAASMGATPPRSGSVPETGLDYVSCSPYRVPIARLAAAQAMVRGKMKGKDGGHRATV